MESLIEAMSQAEAIEIPQDYVSAVKGIFSRAVAQLDPSAELENTGYFNHSAVPDYVLKWKGESPRSVFLRRSYDEIAGWRDVEHLRSADPVIVSLLETAGESAAETAIKTQVSSDKANGLLVTGGLALDRLQRSHRRGADESPITEMVSARLLKSGRGVVDAERAELLVTPDGSLVAELDKSFDPRASAALRSAAELIAAAIDESAPRPTATGPLSVDEARRLLPWLLTRDARRNDAEFWANLGRRLDLRTLQEISEAIQGLDLSLLVRGSWDAWETRRGYLGVAVGVDGDFVATTTPTWFMRERLLNCNIGRNALRFASYGQAFRGRGTLSSALWDRIEPELPTETRLIAISLRGPDKSITLNANDSLDLRDDVAQLLTTTSGNYYVDKLSLEFPGRDSNRRVDIDLGENIVQGDDGATLRDLARALASVVAYASPIRLS